MNDSVVRRITWRASDIVRVLSLVILFLFLWKFFWMVTNAVFLGLLAILLAIGLHAPAKLLSRWMPFRAAFTITVVVFLAALAGLMVAVIPQIVNQVVALAAELPTVVEAMVEWLRGNVYLREVPLTGLSERVSEQVAQFVGRFIPLAVNLFGALLGLVAVLVLAVFFAAQPGRYRELVLRMTPAGTRPRVERVYDEVGKNLRNWVIGKAITMTATGLVVYLGLLLFGIPGALALGTLAGVLDIIPNFGPIVAAVPAIAAGFLVSPQTALWVSIFYIIMHQVQGAVTVPLVENKAVNIPPAALLIWQLMLAIGFGLLALFVATPLLAIIVVATRVLYLEPAEEMAAMDRRAGRPASAAPAADTAPPNRPEPA
ncbi:MAG: AI-2E family transporter [Longimicrobiaceae bacterium]